MQGGVFSPWGDLYLVNSGEEDLSGRGGVRLFDGETHRIIAQSRNGHDPFNFQFDPNYSLEHVPDPGEEPEGVDWWNNDVPQHNTPGIYGQLHVILLNNDIDSDNFWLKHYRVDYWCVTSLDTDGDGLTDGDEAYLHNSDPRDVDTDNDGLSDGVEVNTLGTSPLFEDTDKDGVPDGSEDNDSDGLTNLTEVSGSNPTNPVDEDSDDDGLIDGTEDTNHNGALDMGETDPNDQDSDDDILTDGCEVLGANPTDPLLEDTDDDGLTDGQEDSNKNCAWDSGETDPNNEDTDADQLIDGLEVQYGTNPLDQDTDDDGIQDGEDVEWLQNAIGSLSDSFFKSPASSVKDAMTTLLDDVELAVARGDINTATKLLENLRRHVDGCGTMADANDWILECSAQVQIREYVDIFIANLSS